MTTRSMFQGISYSWEFINNQTHLGN
jgi:hypothetical protein